MKRISRRGGLVALAGLVVMALAGTAWSASRPSSPDARAVLYDASGNQMGVVKFKQGAGSVLVLASVKGLTPGFHGFHVHANNDPINGDGCIADPSQPSNTWFLSADGHYKLGSELHGAHQGDMPILLMNGTGTGDSKAWGTFSTDRFDVADIVGRAVIVHSGPDNFANIPLGTGADQYTANSTAATDKTNATGNAGDRLLCGLVETP